MLKYYEYNRKLYKILIDFKHTYNNVNKYQLWFDEFKYSKKN